MSQYLNCLKGQLDQNYGHFEQEIQADTRLLKCFINFLKKNKKFNQIFI